MAALLLAGGLAGCGRPGREAAAAAPQAPTAEAAGYLAPPSQLAADRSGGATRLVGHAVPGATVRAAAPDGSARATTADAAGRWTLDLPASATPALYALSAQASGREVRAEGALALVPAPAPAALLLRAGYGALPPPLDPAKASAAPRIVAVDYDGGGGAALAGVVRPGAPVRLSVDGRPSDLDTADPGGRFVLTGPKARPLGPGPHDFLIESPGGSARARVVFSPAAPLTAPYHAAHVAEGWRIDWQAPGGALQTTLVLDPAGASAR